MKISSVSLLTWALNEEENVQEFIHKSLELLQDLTDDFEIIFINDGSTDATEEIVVQLMKQYPQIKYSSNGVNMGVGASMKKAISISQKDYLFWQTLDWSYDLNVFRTLNIELNENTIIHGSRVKSLKEIFLKILSRSDNLWKGLISITNYLFIRVLFKLPFNDVQNVSIVPGDFARSTNLLSTSSFISPELLIRANASGKNFYEIFVPFVPRKNGIAKGTKFTSILKSIKDILWFKLYSKKIVKVSGTSNFTKLL